MTAALDLRAFRRRRAGGICGGSRAAVLRLVADDGGDVVDARDVWDLSKPETRDRARVALDGVWRAYAAAERPAWPSELHREAYARLEAELARWEADMVSHSGERKKTGT